MLDKNRKRSGYSLVPERIGREIDLQRAFGATRLARAAPVLADIYQQCVKLVVEARVGRQMGLEQRTHGFVIQPVIRFPRGQTVPAENAVGVSVDDEDGVSPRVEQDRIGGL